MRYILNGVEWLNSNNKRHSVDDLPAVELKDGYKAWYKNGVLDRYGNPAIMYPSGSMSWYTNGELNSQDDKPAIVCASGLKKWYKNNKLHRDNDCPSVEYSDGSGLWYKNGDLHRINGLPAVDIPNSKAWFVNNKFIPKHKVNSVLKISRWYKRMKQRKFVLLVWRVMTPIYFHPDEIGGKKAIRYLEEFDMMLYNNLQTRK